MWTAIIGQGLALVVLVVTWWLERSKIRVSKKVDKAVKLVEEAKKQGDKAITALRKRRLKDYEEELNRVLDRLGTVQRLRDKKLAAKRGEGA